MGEDESRAQNVGTNAVLGVVGQGAASGLGALARGTTSRISKGAADLAKAAEARGIRLSVPQLSENPMVRTVASQLERLPFSGAARRNDANQEAFNRAVGKTFGADAGRITPDVFESAKQALSARFEQLSARNNLAPTPQLMQQLGGVIDDAQRLSVGDTGRVVSNWVDDLLNKTDKNGLIPGKVYQSFDSKIGKQMKAGGETAVYLGRIRDAVREQMDRSISPMDTKAWQQARQQWANLKTVEPLVAKSVNGNLPPSQLMGRVTADKASKSRMAVGKGGELGTLAKVGQQFLKDSPNSGTADRLLANSVVGGALYGAQGANLITPDQALMMAGGLLGNRALQKAMASKGLTMGGNKALLGLARTAKPLPKLAPAAVGGLLAPSDSLEIDVVGGTPVTDEEFFREYGFYPR